MRIEPYTEARLLVDKDAESYWPAGSRGLVIERFVSPEGYLLEMRHPDGSLACDFVDARPDEVEPWTARAAIA